MTTREEFEELIYDLVICENDVSRHISNGDRGAAYLAARDRRGRSWRRAFSAFDNQAAQIAELESEAAQLRVRNAELAAQRLELDDRAYYDGRIAELEETLAILSTNALNRLELLGAKDRRVAELEEQVASLQDAHIDRDTEGNNDNTQ